jgi:hypothetical protein
VAQVDRYVEGSTRAKVWHFSIWAVVAVAMVALNVLFPTPDAIHSVSDIQAIAQRYLARAVLFTAFLVPLSLWTITVARLSIKHGHWPPPEIQVPFRTRIIPIARPTLVYVVVGAFLGTILLVVAVSFHGWYWLSQMALGVAHAT